MRIIAEDYGAPCDLCRAGLPSETQLAGIAVWRYRICQMATRDLLTTQRLVSTLGGRRALRSRVANLEALRVRLQQGLPYGSLAALTSTYDIDRKTLAAVLQIPERTLARR